MNNNLVVFILCAIILILDLYVMRLDRKVKNITAKLSDLQKANQTLADNSKELASTTMKINDQVIDLINVNKGLGEINKQLVNEVLRKLEGLVNNG